MHIRTHIRMCSLSVNTGVILHNIVWLPDDSCQSAFNGVQTAPIFCLHSSLGHCTAPASVCIGSWH